MIKVMLADDHSIVRTGLCSLIEDCDDMIVVAEASDGNTTIGMALDKKEVLAYRVALDSTALDPLASLSSREKQVLHCLALGQSIGEMAHKLGLSTKTVSTYRSRLLKKLDLKNNVELALFAVRNRIIELS